MRYWIFIDWAEKSRREYLSVPGVRDSPELQRRFISGHREQSREPDRGFTPWKAEVCIMAITSPACLGHCTRLSIQMTRAGEVSMEMEVRRFLFLFPFSIKPSSRFVSSAPRNLKMTISNPIGTRASCSAESLGSCYGKFRPRAGKVQFSCDDSFIFPLLAWFFPTVFKAAWLQDLALLNFNISKGCSSFAWKLYRF